MPSAALFGHFWDVKSEIGKTGKAKPDRTKWTPPRGIRLYEITGRPERPYAVQWRVGGKAKTKTFENRESQMAFAKALAAESREHGLDAFRLNTEEAREWRAFRAEIGKDTQLDAVLACWRKYGSAEAAASPLIRDLVERYLNFREHDTRWGLSAARHARKHLERFVSRFGDRRAASIMREELREFLFGRVEKDGTRVGVLTDDRGNPIGDHGIRDHRKNINTMFAYAVRERWGLVVNECEFVLPPKVSDGDPIVMPLRDAFEFFRANIDQPLIGRIALEAFGFVRHGTAGEITREAIDFDRRGIRMASSIHKTGKVDGKTRYRQGHPDNLWAWLKHAPAECWAMTELKYREAKRAAMIRAGLRPIENSSDEDDAKIKGLRNIWRHTVISYHLAWKNDPGLTQRLAQHSSYEQTEEYAGMASAQDGAGYFAITPEMARLTWEQFASMVSG